MSIKKLSEVVHSLINEDVASAKAHLRAYMDSKSKVILSEESYGDRFLDVRAVEAIDYVISLNDKGELDKANLWNVVKKYITDEFSQTFRGEYDINMFTERVVYMFHKHRPDIMQGIKKPNPTGPNSMLKTPEQKAQDEYESRFNGP